MPCPLEHKTSSTPALKSVIIVAIPQSHNEFLLLKTLSLPTFKKNKQQLR